MEENKNAVNLLDDVSKRHREMTQERNIKRKRILEHSAAAAGGIGVAIGTAAFVARMARAVLPLFEIPIFDQVLVGGAMGQWEEIPLQEDQLTTK